MVYNHPGEAPVWNAAMPGGPIVMWFQSMPVGVQSCSLGTVQDLDALGATLAGLGVGRAELCPAHVGPKAAQIEVKDALVRLRYAGIEVNAWGVLAMGRDEAEDRRIFLWCRLMGLSTVIADPEPAALARLEALGAEYGVRIAIHNGGAAHRWGTRAALASVLEATGRWVGLCVDTGHLLRAGEDPKAIIGLAKDRLYAVHLKDSAAVPAHGWSDVPLGRGRLDARGVLNALVVSGFAGSLSLEYGGDPDRALEALGESLRFLARAADGAGADQGVQRKVVK